MKTIKELKEYINKNGFQVEYISKNLKLDIFWLKKAHLDWYQKIKDFRASHTKCISCGDYFDKSLKRIFCDKEECQHFKTIRSEKSKKKYRETMLERYGVSHTSHLPEVQKKRKETCLKKYGVEYSCLNPEVKAKKDKTCLERYGTIHPMQNKEIALKKEQTNIEKYGVKTTLLVPEVQEKIKETNKKNLGAENPFSSPIIKQKIKQTFLNTLGVENPSQSEEIKMKKVESNLKKFGFEYPAQSPECKERFRETTLKNFLKQNIKNSLPMLDKIKATILEKYNIDLNSVEINDEILELIKNEYNEIKFFHLGFLNLKNYENFNESFIKKNFIKENLFLASEYSEYFNVSIFQIPKHKEYFNILEPNKTRWGEKERGFLDFIEESFNIEIERQASILNFKVDGFLRLESDLTINEIKLFKGDNIIFEYLGNFWHGYDRSDTINPISKKTSRDLYNGTYTRFNVILSSSEIENLRILYCWESEFEDFGMDTIKEYVLDSNEL